METNSIATTPAAVIPRLTYLFPARGWKLYKAIAIDGQLG
jgi:hypothetical protein